MIKIGRLGGLTGLALVVGTCLTLGLKKTDVFDGRIPSGVYNEGREINIPAYNEFKINPLQCSKYVRMAAKDLFKEDYALCDAWERRYQDKLVCEVNDRNLEDIEKQGELLPGMIIGFYNPQSKYNGIKDSKGNPVRYTHNVLYIGKNQTGELVFAEQRGKKVKRSTLNSLENSGLKPIEIFYTKKL